MKNTISKHHEAVLAFLKANPNSTFDTIKEGCKTISDIMLRKAVKDLQAEGVIAANDEDGGYIFAGALKKGEAKDAKPEKKEVVKEDVKTSLKSNEDEDLGAPTAHGRDYSKYDFNNQKSLSKSRLCLAIVKEYVSKNPKITFTKLEEVFKSKEIQKRYGVVQELSKAKKISGTRDRYFMKPEEILKVGNQKVCVCNQLSSETLKPILGIARSLGYKITISK